MTFTNKWGTAYPEDVRKYVNPGTMIDLDRNIKKVATDVTASANTTDEAIMAIHEFIKNMPVGKVPIVLDVPVKPASEQLSEYQSNPSGKSYSYNKVILEVAMLRALDIPSRPATYQCDLTLPITSERRASNPALMKSPHHATEVYTTDIDGSWKFKLKDSWVPESACKSFPGSCIVDEKKEWMKKRQVSGLQGDLSCTKIGDSVDYPVVFSGVINALNIAREWLPFLNEVDPSGDIP